jgi:hypothetical protein
MRLKLKEDPREWRKFVLLLGVVGGVLAFVFWIKGTLSDFAWVCILSVLILWLIVGLLRPRWIRPLYRGWMGGGFYVGQMMGRVLLTVIFLLIVLPTGWLLRLRGKDLLQIKRQPGQLSYWQPAKTPDRFDRLF